MVQITKCIGCGELKEKFMKGSCKQCYRRKYSQNNKEYIKEYHKEYCQRPEVKERDKKRSKEYNQRPEIRERNKKRDREYYQKNKERIKIYDKKRGKIYYNNNKEKKKIYQVKRLYNLSLKEYKKVIKQCYLCSYTRTVDCHHINGKGDNSKLIGLCPNHHRLVHTNKLNKAEISKLNNYGEPTNDNIQML